MSLYKIAGHVLSIDLPDEYLHNNLSAFLYDGVSSAELSIQSETDALTTEEARAYLMAHMDDRLLFSRYMIVLQTESGYRIFYSEEPRILYCDIDIYSWNVTIQLSTEERKLSGCSGCSGSMNTNGCSDCPSIKQKGSSNTTDTQESPMVLKDYLFYVMRDVFFTFGQTVGLLPIHSSTIIYKNKAYLFSACSGTGKTTHTDMWVKRFGVEILDGDVTILSCENEHLYAYGLPWCGTSNKFMNKKVITGGIVFLSQAKFNSVETLSIYQSILSITSRSFAPTWTKELTDKTICLAQQIADHTVCHLLHCLPDDEAVDVIKSLIDNNNE